jgi:hypothetical protein
MDYKAAAMALTVRIKRLSDDCVQLCGQRGHHAAAGGLLTKLLHTVEQVWPRSGGGSVVMHPGRK